MQREQHGSAKHRESRMTPHTEFGPVFVQQSERQRHWGLRLQSAEKPVIWGEPEQRAILAKTQANTQLVFYIANVVQETRNE